MTSIYGLKLQHNKYYVGRSNNVSNRIEQHKNGIGSTWTKKHKPIEVLFIKESTSVFDEDKYTKELMVKYGIDSTRGGTYSSPLLTNDQKKLLQKEIWSCLDYCNRCGSSKHFVIDCTSTKDVNGNIIDSINTIKITNKPCKRCGRIGHNNTNCFAHTKLDGTPIKVRTCSRCKRPGHKKPDCFAKTDINNNPLL